MKNRTLHWLRSTCSPVIERLSGGDYKAKLPQHDGEYVMTLDCSLSEAEQILHRYSYQPFAARKFLDGYGRDDGSYMRVDPDDWTKQYHVHLYDTEHGVQVYSHWEYRVIFPFKHYNSAEYEYESLLPSPDGLPTTELPDSRTET